MKLKNIALLALTLLALSSCNKKDKPLKKDYFFTYNVRIANKITEPTIISGYHGTVNFYEGDFMPKKNPETGEAIINKPKPVRNEILIYTGDHKGKIDSVAYEDNGFKFYDLKKLKKQKVKPKYIIKPNKSGFYQIDLGTGEYVALIRVKKTKGYFNGGARILSATTGTLKELEMMIDYKATF